jgi:hypothetical protein
MNNQENIPPPPSLTRQLTGLIPFPDPVPPELDYRILPVPEDPRQDPLLEMHGGFDWEPLPNGLDGYTLEDYENIARNNGWFVPEDFEFEDVTDDSDDEEEDEEEEEEDNDVPPRF